MKSNISKKEIDSGKKIIDTLLVSNPRLLPFYLKNDLPKYKKFLPDINKYGLWLSSKITKKNKIAQKYDKIIFLCSGLAASGKDSIYNEMIKLCPDLFFKTVTATSRPSRENEVNEVDHYFLKNIDDFKQGIKNQEYLEFIKRGENYYGLPKKSLYHALLQPIPIIYCQIEMSGWSNLEKYISSLKNKNILIIKCFIFPDMSMSEYINWLTQKRVGEDLDSRINKSGWEIKKAAQKVDLIITNRIRENIPTLTYTAKTILNQIIETANLTDIKKFSTPTDNLKFTIDIEKIIDSHDSIS
jgi:guanylate kinase